MVKKNTFLFMFMLSLCACGRPEFGKASTDDRVIINDTPAANNKSDENNGFSSTNNGISNGAVDPAPGRQAVPVVYTSLSTHDNFVYAPKSIAQILNALSLLASDQTQDALEDFEYDGLSNIAPSNFASLWIDDTLQIENDLVAGLSDIDVDVRQISLSSTDARTHINNVAREKTEGYLAELLPAVQTLDGDFLLTTGSFYTVAFKNGFDIEKTYENTFFGKTTRDRKFMVQSGIYKIIDNDDLTALSIEMENDQVLVLMMPKGGLLDLEEQISASFIARLLDEMSPENVKIHIPQMDFVNTFTFSDFSNIIDLENASFSNLGENVQLGAILHQVRFILNEDGIQYDNLPEVGDPSDPGATLSNALRFDRPFVFSIYDPNLQEVELLGRMTQ